MSTLIKRTKRTATSWDQDFEPRVKDLREYLERLTGKNKSENKEIFMLCLAIGFDLKKMRPTRRRKSDAVRLSYFSEADFAIMNSIALSHSKDYLTLTEQDLVFDIVEQYAAGGLEILALAMDTEDNFVNYLSKLLFNKIKNNSQL